MANPTGAPRTLLPTAGAISILLPLWRQDPRNWCICVFAFVYLCICIYIWRSRRTSIWTSAPPNLPLLPNHSPRAVSRALTPFLCESNIIYILHNYKTSWIQPDQLSIHLESLAGEMQGQVKPGEEETREIVEEALIKNNSVSDLIRLEVEGTLWRWEVVVSTL